MPNFSHSNSEQGLSILLVILVIALGFAIVLGLAGVFVNELLIARRANHSTVAIYAADAGLERALYVDRLGGGLSQCPEGGLPCEQATLPAPTPTFRYYVEDIGGTRRIKAIGSFRSTNRALEIDYPVSP